MTILPIAKRLIHGLTRAMEERGKFGMTYMELMKFLPTQAELQNLLIDAYWHQWQRTDDVFSIPTLYEISGRLKSLLTPNLKQEFANRSTDERKQLIDLGVTIGLLPRLIRLIDGRSNNNLTLSASGQIVITQRSYQHANSLAKTQNTFLMDATPDLIDLARKLNIPSREILQLESKRPTFENLTLHFVNGMGRLGAQREHYQDGAVVDSPYSQQTRVEAAVSAIARKYPGSQMGILDRKSFIDRYTELDGLQDITLVTGHHFCDNRNSNRYQECNTIITVGLPVKNLGAQQSEWHVMTGQSTQTSQFWAWVNRQTIHELIQDIGRGRAQHRPDEQIHHWILSDLSEAQKRAIVDYFPGCKRVNINAYELTPLAATKGQQTTRAILEAMWNGLSTGEKSTINDLARKAGVSVGRVSQIAKKLHPSGLRGLRKILVLLLEGLYSGSHAGEVQIERPINSILCRSHATLLA